MREIKFKAKRIDNNEWVYGSSIINTPEYCFIFGKNIDSNLNLWCRETNFHIGGMIKVFPETVCNFTGLIDRNKKEIYEGDVCIMHMPNTWGDDGELSKEVENIVISFEWKNNGWYLNGFNKLCGTYYWGSIAGDMLEVTGNIHNK